MNEGLFDNPPMFLALLAAILLGIGMMKFKRPWLAALSGFFMLVFGWWFIGGFDISFYPSARTLLAIALLIFYGIGLVNIPGRPLSIVGSVLIVIGIFAFSRTAPFDAINFSTLLEGGVMENAGRVWDNIFDRAADVTG